MKNLSQISVILMNNLSHFGHLRLAGSSTRRLIRTFFVSLSRCVRHIFASATVVTSQQLSIPRTKLNLGKRAFSVAAPIIWNELPTTLKSCESLVSFGKNLKTYLFKIAFPP